MVVATGQSPANINDYDYGALLSLNQGKRGLGYALEVSIPPSPGCTPPHKIRNLQGCRGGSKQMFSLLDHVLYTLSPLLRLTCTFSLVMSVDEETIHY